MVEEKIKSISPLIGQMCLRNLGLYSSSYLANDIYFLIETVNLLINDIGEEFIEKKYKEAGKDWGEVKKKLINLNKLIVKVKTFYDPIEDKKFSKKDQENILKRYFIKTASKVALIQHELYEIFVFLVKISSIQRQTIPAEAFKILEHSQFRKIDLARKPFSSMPTEIPEVVAEG